MKPAAGFTLIEVLIYLALFTIIIGGAIVSVYSILEGSSRTARRILAQEEGNFLLRKIDWALTNATAITLPLPGASGTALSVTKADLPPAESPLVFALNNTTMRLSRGGGVSHRLTSATVAVSEVMFRHIAARDNTPAAIVVNFRVEGQAFHLTKYLRI